MAKSGFGGAALQKLLKAKQAASRAGSRVRKSGAIERVAVVGTTVVGGVAGGALDGAFGGKKTFGLAPATIGGAIGGVVSLFLKGRVGDTLAHASGGALAYAAGAATKKAVSKAKVSELLDGLAPKRPAAEREVEATRTGPKLQPAEPLRRDNPADVSHTRASGAPHALPDRANGTALSAADLEAYARGVEAP